MNQSYSQFRAMLAIIKGQPESHSQKSFCSYFQSGISTCFYFGIRIYRRRRNIGYDSIEKSGRQFKLCHSRALQAGIVRIKKKDDKDNLLH